MTKWTPYELGEEMKRAFSAYDAGYGRDLIDQAIALLQDPKRNAADELYEALETTKRMLDDTMKWHTVVDADTMTTLGETIDAALAKARGEQ